jgi:hypothetical protein
MFTVKQVGEVKTGLKRITLLSDDGSETVVNVSDSIHYLVAFAQVGPSKEEGSPAEVLVKGDVEIVGELYYQIGKSHPDLVRHCVRRSTEKVAKSIIDEIKRSGVDPIGEALKKMPTPEAKGGWN